MNNLFTFVDWKHQIAKIKPTTCICKLRQVDSSIGRCETQRKPVVLWSGAFTPSKEVPLETFVGFCCKIPSEGHIKSHKHQLGQAI